MYTKYSRLTEIHWQHLGGSGRRVTVVSTWQRVRTHGRARRGARATSPLGSRLPLFDCNNSKFLNCVTKTLDTKVVDETSLYNICKVQHMFWWVVWLGTRDEVQDFPWFKTLPNGLWLSFWAPILQNLKCRQLGKMCPLKRQTSFILVDFEVLKQNLENAPKVLEFGMDIRGFDLGLTTNDCWLD
jgi:hypothetical protein